MSLFAVVLLASCSGSAEQATKAPERAEPSATAAQHASPASPPPSTSPANYVSGTLVAASPESFSVDDGAGTHTYPLGPATQICRESCSATWLALRAGDRIQASVDMSADPPQTHWVNVNAWTDDAQVDAIDGNRLVVHSTRHPGQPSPTYTVLVGPDTRVNPRSDGVAAAVGSFPGAHVGGDIYVLGSAQGADDSSVVFATTIYG